MQAENSYGQDVLFFLMPAHQTGQIIPREKRKRERERERERGVRRDKDGMLTQMSQSVGEGGINP